MPLDIRLKFERVSYLVRVDLRSCPLLELEDWSADGTVSRSMAGAFRVVWENPAAPPWGAWISIADGAGAGNGQKSGFGGADGDATRTARTRQGSGKTTAPLLDDAVGHALVVAQHAVDVVAARHDPEFLGSAWASRQSPAHRRPRSPGRRRRPDRRPDIR